MADSRCHQPGADDIPVAATPDAGLAADPEEVRLAVAGSTGTRLDDVQVRETHISWLFLAGDRAYKLKKPVVMEFLDYGTPRRRRMMCRAEVALNGRLAADLYLGVRAVVFDENGLDIVDEDDPAAIDYVVEMRRYDEEQTLAAAARRGQVRASQINALGALLAGFHRDCPARPGPQGAIAVRREIEQNLREVRDRVYDQGAHDRLRTLARFLETFLAARRPTLDARAETGRVREGHGDLRAEHVILAPALRVVDCVEFDPELRTLDVADDLGFLVMDLCAHDADTHGRELVAAYREAGGDCGTDELLWFFAAHRALVRVKVELLRAGQAAPASAWQRLQPAADQLLGIAERCAWRARGRFVLVVCGVPASGKSHLAARLAASFGIPALSSDVVRKALAGLESDDRAPPELYQPEFNLRTYRELGRRAAESLKAGPSVVIDATFRHRSDRTAFADALGHDVRTRFLECLAPADVLARRAAERQRDPARASDATADVVERERHVFAPLDEVSPADHLALRTDRPVAEVIADLLALLDQRAPAG